MLFGCSGDRGSALGFAPLGTLAVPAVAALLLGDLGRRWPRPRGGHQRRPGRPRLLLVAAASRQTPLLEVDGRLQQALILPRAGRGILFLGNARQRTHVGPLLGLHLVREQFPHHSSRVLGRLARQVIRHRRTALLQTSFGNLQHANQEITKNCEDEFCSVWKMCLAVTEIIFTSNVFSLIFLLKCNV